VHWADNPLGLKNAKQNIFDCQNDKILTIPFMTKSVIQQIKHLNINKNDCHLLSYVNSLIVHPFFKIIVDVSATVAAFFRDP